MPRFGNLFGGGATSNSASSTAPNSLASSRHPSTTSLASHPSRTELENLDSALGATVHILSDDLATAETQLKEHDSPFHKLGLATTSFMKAVLSFENEAMKEASERLGEAAGSAGAEFARAQKARSGGGMYFESEIYERGTQYSLSQAEAWILGAVVGVLNFSTIEAMKGFLNIRKAYLVMDAVVQREKVFAEKHKGSAPRRSVEQFGSARQSVEVPQPVGGRGVSAAGGMPNGKSAASRSEHTRPEEDSDDEDQFVDAPQWHVGPVPNAGYLGHVASSGANHDPPTNNMAGLSLHDNKQTDTSSARNTTSTAPPLYKDVTIDDLDNDDSDILPRHLIKNDMDAYIHSSTHLFFGLLQLMLSLIPPTMSRLLSTIGFSGSRSLGLQMLWRAADFPNLNGAMAGIILTSYYTGLVAYLDILPASGPGAFPIERCKRLIRQMRDRYPKSTLVMLQEVRMLTTERKLGEAVDMISSAPESAMKQVQALQWFEKSLDCMYAHRYLECADGFEKCITLNNWSHGLYIYIAAICHVELYRTNHSSNPTLAAKHAEKATALLHKVPENTGKKKFLSKGLPFDIFVNRKYAKWTARAKTMGVPLIDAVGVSPVEEMIFWWGGYARMGEKELKDSLSRLGWSDGGGAVIQSLGLARGEQLVNPHAAEMWKKESADERAILDFLRATVLRQLGHVDAAHAMLRKELILRHPNGVEVQAIKNADTWPLPVARYEMAVCYWVRTAEGRRMAQTEAMGAAVTKGTVADRDQVTDDEGRKLSNRQALELCREWLEKVQGTVDTWELESRFGMRISTARETLKGLGIGL